MTDSRRNTLTKSSTTPRSTLTERFTPTASKTFGVCSSAVSTEPYVSVEPFHLFRYLDEQVYRFENRATPDNPLNDFDRFRMAANQIVGKRLTWEQVTGKADGATCPN